jgi:two-component system NtrC family response regulator|tara:strand:+ start:84 stop:563 length:480 start_codon:yes stop_codon:yes gene_type:complete
MIGEGTFREDLYYRLNEIHVHIPPLRDRQGDAMLLARFFLDRFNEQYKKSMRGYSDSAFAAIGGHRWPGNVRQLENVIKKAVIMADGKTITPGDLGLGDAVDRGDLLTLKEVREMSERRHLQEVLAATDGNVSKTAKLLGVSRPTLYDLMRNLDVRVEE